MLRSMLYVRYGSGCSRRVTASAARPSAARSCDSSSCRPSSGVRRSPSTALCQAVGQWLESKIQLRAGAQRPAGAAAGDRTVPSRAARAGPDKNTDCRAGTTSIAAASSPAPVPRAAAISLQMGHARVAGLAQAPPPDRPARRPAERSTWQTQTAVPTSGTTRLPSPTQRRNAPRANAWPDRRSTVPRRPRVSASDAPIGSGSSRGRSP